MEVAASQCKILRQRLPTITEKNHETPEVARPICGPRDMYSEHYEIEVLISSSQDSV
jgi:hypothetical protein